MRLMFDDYVHCTLPGWIMVGRIVIEYRPKPRIKVTAQQPLEIGVQKMVEPFFLNTTATHGLSSSR
jgi:hypothetical protein